MIRSPHPALDFARAVRRLVGSAASRARCARVGAARARRARRPERLGRTGLRAGRRVPGGSAQHPARERDALRRACGSARTAGSTRAACLREHTQLGDRVVLQPGVVLGGDGFGYVITDAGELEAMPQLGRVVVGDDVEIGANTTVDRGTLGDTRIEAGAKLDNLVQVGHNVVIGESAVVVAQAGVAGSARIGRGAVIMSQAGIPDHVTIGERAYVGPKSGVHGDVAAGARVMGYPHRDMRAFQRIFAALGLLPALVTRVRALERGPAQAIARQAPAREEDRARAGAAARRVDGSRGPVARGAARALLSPRTTSPSGSNGSPRCGGTRAAARALSRACSSDARTPSVGSRRDCDGLFALRARLFAAGARCVAGVDEVGMGPLAGPVLAAAVILGERPSLPGLDDSKRLSRAARERIAAQHPRAGARDRARDRRARRDRPPEHLPRGSRGHAPRRAGARARAGPRARRRAHDSGPRLRADRDRGGRRPGRLDRRGVDRGEGRARRDHAPPRRAPSRLGTGSAHGLSDPAAPRGAARASGRRPSTAGRSHPSRASRPATPDGALAQRAGGFPGRRDSAVFRVRRGRPHLRAHREAFAQHRGAGARSRARRRRATGRRRLCRTQGSRRRDDPVVLGPGPRARGRARARAARRERDRGAPPSPQAAHGTAARESLRDRRARGRRGDPARRSPRASSACSARGCRIASARSASAGTAATSSRRSGCCAASASASTGATRASCSRRCRPPSSTRCWRSDRCRSTSSSWATSRCVHASGGQFVVEDLAREAPRAAAFEISATGPIFGTRVIEPTGAAAERERAALAALGVDRERAEAAARDPTARGAARAARAAGRARTSPSRATRCGCASRCLRGATRRVALEELLGPHAGSDDTRRGSGLS